MWKADLNGYGDDLWFGPPLGSRQTVAIGQRPLDESFAVMIAEGSGNFSEAERRVVDGLVEVSVHCRRNRPAPIRSKTFENGRDQLVSVGPRAVGRVRTSCMSRRSPSGRRPGRAGSSLSTTTGLYWKRSVRGQSPPTPERATRDRRPGSTDLCPFRTWSYRRRAVSSATKIPTLTVMLTIFANQGDPTAKRLVRSVGRGAIRKWFIPAARVVRLSERYEARPSTPSPPV